MTCCLIRDDAHEHLIAYRGQVCSARQVSNAALRQPRRINRVTVFLALKLAPSAYFLAEPFKV